MELLFLLLLSPSAILCQIYRSGSLSSPNDEPFLPIYPVYPYSPKLMKRGTDAEVPAPLTAELYAPKSDARDSYTSSYGGNYHGDPYYPSYNPYPKTSTRFPAGSSVASAVYNSASFANPNTYGTSSANYGNRNAYTTPASASYSPYSAGYSSPYSYTAAPYGTYNSYGSAYTQPPNPYGTNPYAAPSYPNYQPPYYYPSYYNQPYPPLPPPPPPPHASQDYAGSEDSSDEDEKNVKTSRKKKPDGKKNRSKDDDTEANSETKDGQFIDGVNYLSSVKDLDGQSTSYKAPYNQLDQLSDLHLRSLPIPGLSRTTYRVISVGGQPVGPDYPLPPNYAKVQQLEQIMGQTLAKLLAQNQAARQQINDRYRINEPSSDQAAYGGAGFVNKSPPGVIAKTGLAYVVNPINLPKPGSNVQNQFVESYASPSSPVIVQDPNHGLQQSSTVLAKAVGKYGERRYPQKSVTTVSLQQAPGVYIPPEAKNIKDDSSQSSEYDYDANPSQSYDNAYKKNEQNYSIDQTGQTANYQNSNLVTVQTPQTYQYSSYLPSQTNQEQQPRDYKTNLDEVNFPTKRNTKA